MTTIVTASGARRELPESIDLEKVAGLDMEGRIVVDWFDARNPENVPVMREYADGQKFLDRPHLFGLTLCCNASDKGTEFGVVCRACYGAKRNADEGWYLFKEDDGTFPDLDPTVEVLP
jgi:hypothetical protein